MKQLTALLQRHSLLIGILLMFLLTWPIDLANAGVVPFHVPFVVAILVGWGFGFASLIMTGLTLGREGVIVLLKRFLIWRVGWQWYLVACWLYPAILSSAVLLNAILTAKAIDFSTVAAHQIFGPAAHLPSLILPFLLFDAITNGEEMGMNKFASIILGSTLLLAVATCQPVATPPVVAAKSWPKIHPVPHRQRNPLFGASATRGLRLGHT